MRHQHIPISCELPNSLLEYNLSLNNFDFVLYHLYRSNKIYKEYYDKIRKYRHQRECILDNSAYEFSVTGQVFDLDDFMLSISELRPDLIIAPDTPGNLRKTQDSLEDFYELCRLRDPLGIKGETLGQNYKDHIMPVAQGQSSGQLIESLYEYSYRGYPYVAIPFHNPAFLEIYGPTDYDFSMLRSYTKKTQEGQLDDQYARGRVRFISENLEFLASNFDRVHLLGSHNPIEKRGHREVLSKTQEILDNNEPFVLSMDTGYPVKCGVSGIALGQETEKPSLIIDDFIDSEFEQANKDLIIQNIYKFRSY